MLLQSIWNLMFEKKDEFMFIIGILIYSFLFIIEPILVTSILLIMFILIKPRKLNKRQTEYLLNNPIIHLTTDIGASNIEKTKYIKTSNRINSYSNYFKPACFFFYKEPNKRRKNFNLSDKEISCAVKIQLTKNEISNFRYRLVDMAIFKSDNFTFENLSYSIEKLQ